MPRLEEVIRRIWQTQDAPPRLLVGGLLAFLPIINLLVLGYVYLVAYGVRDRRRLELPSWGNWRDILAATLKALMVLLPYVGLPVLVGLLLSGALAWLLGWVGLQLFAGLPVGLAILLGLMLGQVALQVFMQEGEDPRVLLRLDLVLTQAARCWDALLIPTLALVGLWFLGIGIYGLVGFVGWFIYSVYVSAVFQHLGARKEPDNRW